ncbi:protein kinase [Streptomyces sp. NPDC051920]|uniref:protein kinase n=1 Tax=Streptomyces sp. NPDC051920 TaxID=3155523 RepID=UPI003422431E
MDDYAGRVLADRYRLPLPPSGEYELAESRAFDTYSGQEVLVRQVPLPEVVEAEVLDADGLPDGFVARDGGVRRASARTTRRSVEPAVLRAIEAAQAAARIPDHPRLDQVFDVFAEGGSLWIVSELVPARPLAALLAEKPLSPYRAAEVAADVLTALRVLHAHGWVHRNITVRTVLVCDDGRVLLTGLAAGAAEEALCGYDPVPAPEDDFTTGHGSGPRAGQPGDAGPAGAGAPQGGAGRGPGSGPGGGQGAVGGRGPVVGGGFGGGASRGVAVAATSGADAEAARRAAIEARAEQGTPVPGAPVPGAPAAGRGPRALEASGPAGPGRPTGTAGPDGGPETGGQAEGAGDDVRAARAGAIAAYRAGARAAARVQGERRGDPLALPAPRPSAPGEHPTQDSRYGTSPHTPGAQPPAPPSQVPGQGSQYGASPYASGSQAPAPSSHVPGQGSQYGASSHAPGSQAPAPSSHVPGQDSRYGASPYAPGSQTSAPSSHVPGQGGPYGASPHAEGSQGSGSSSHPPGQGGQYGASPYAPGAQAPTTPQLPGQDGRQQAQGAPPGQIADPYGVGGTGRYGVQARSAGDNGRTRPTLPPGPGAEGAGGDTAYGRSALAPGQAPYGTGQGGRPGVPAPGRPLGGERAPDDGRSTGGFRAPGGAQVPVPPGGFTGTGNTRTPGASPAPDHTRAPGTPQGLAPAAHPSGRPGGGWGDLVAGAPPRRGPATALAAERARQARMAVVGPVTERWAPEQAGPVHENWQLAAPIGPATDLWALGALLFRAVQGHAPYPEENTAELVQLVCAEPPAFAEECGPLRPVVESLLRQDPTERLDFEELRGWLRSLVRSAPEPEAGAHVVPVPPADPSRLPIVRRRGELVRRRRAGLPATSAHARHKRARQENAAGPRRLGRNLLLLILLLLAAAVTYAVVFMPKADRGGTDGGRTGAAGQAGPATQPGGDPTASNAPGSDQTSPDPDKSPSGKSSSTSSHTTADPDVAQGFTLRKDPEGFQVAVASGWTRSPKNGRGQVVYSQGDFELIVVPGRDGTATYGSDPMTYQRESEKELQPFRDSTWATSSGMRRIDVGGKVMAEGQFTWQDSAGRSLYVRNLAILIAGHYHVVQLRGPDAERDEVSRLYEQASSTYRVTR